MLIPVSVTVSGRCLYGMLERPLGSPLGGVVIVHGWGGCRIGPNRILVEMARRFVAEGLAALRFDLSGRGESEGETAETDLDTMIQDTDQWLSWLRNELGDGLPMGALGICSGGNVALAAAAFRQDVAAVVAWSTYPFQEQRRLTQDLGRTGHFAGVYLRKALDVQTWRRLVGGQVNLRGVRQTLFGHLRRREDGERVRQRSRRDVLGALASYRGRVLFVYGGMDPEAPAAEQTFAEFCRRHGLRADFRTVQAATHNFQALDHKREAIETSALWLKGALLG